MAVLIKILAWVSTIGNAALETVVFYAAICYIRDRRGKRGDSDS